VQQADLSGIMQENLNKLNKLVARYEQVSSVQLVEEEFEKTPKKNIKRFKYL
jgi:long-chain acyl-CoA synthetase